MIKKLWTSSFVVYASGWSLLLLSLFYLVIDLWGLRKAFLPFMLIGVNPITIYLFARIIDFRHTAKFLFGGMIRIAGEPLEPVVFAASVLICELLFLFILYRKKIFLKV